MQEKDKMKLLQTLNATVHHEMMSPLKANVKLSKDLRNKLINPRHKKMADLIYSSSSLILLHASDLLDQRVIEKGYFKASLQLGDV